MQAHQRLEKRLRRLPGVIDAVEPLAQGSQNHGCHADQAGPVAAGLRQLTGPQHIRQDVHVARGRVRNTPRLFEIQPRMRHHLRPGTGQKPAHHTRCTRKIAAGLHLASDPLGQQVALFDLRQRLHGVGLTT